MIPNKLSDLTILERKWLDLFADLRQCPANYDVDATTLAAPFLSTRLPGYDDCGAGTVMIVGKATSGNNTLGNIPVQDNYDVCTVKLRPPGVIEEVLEGSERSHFLHFALLLSCQVARTTGVHCAPFTNLIWTNLLKIGCTLDNPAAALREQQADLAFETLLAEVNEYKPSLVVITTDYYCNGLMCRTLREMIGCAPSPTDQKRGWWAHEAGEKGPAVLWTKHPAGKPGKVWKEWLWQARRLLE